VSAFVTPKYHVQRNHGLFRCGKTTLARLIAQRENVAFKELSATTAGITDVREAIEASKGKAFFSQK
jgi:replication-associated recombination protein RarA